MLSVRFRKTAAAANSLTSWLTVKIENWTANNKLCLNRDRTNKKFIISLPTFG